MSIHYVTIVTKHYVTKQIYLFSLANPRTIRMSNDV